MLVQCLVVAELMHQPRRSPTSVNSNVTTPVGRPPTTAHDHAPTPVCCPADERRRRRWESAQWFVETPLRSLETAPEPADEAVLRDPEVRANFAASNLEGARQGQAGLVGDWVADALPWGFRLADVGVPVDLWIGERDPGRAPLDAPEIARRIPSCAVHADPDAGHWLVISRWSDIVEQSLA